MFQGRGANSLGSSLFLLRTSLLDVEPAHERLRELGSVGDQFVEREPARQFFFVRSREVGLGTGVGARARGSGTFPQPSRARHLLLSSER